MNVRFVLAAVACAITVASSVADPDHHLRYEPIAAVAPALPEERFLEEENTNSTTPPPTSDPPTTAPVTPSPTPTTAPPTTSPTPTDSPTTAPPTTAPPTTAPPTTAPPTTAPPTTGPPTTAPPTTALPTTAPPTTPPPKSTEPPKPTTSQPPPTTSPPKTTEPPKPTNTTAKPTEKPAPTTVSPKPTEHQTEKATEASETPESTEKVNPEPLDHPTTAKQDQKGSQAPSTSSNTKGSSSGLSAGAIAGIVIGAVAALGVVALMFSHFRRRKYREAADDDLLSPMSSFDKSLGIGMGTTGGGAGQSYQQGQQLDRTIPMMGAPNGNRPQEMVSYYDAMHSPNAPILEAAYNGAQRPAAQSGARAGAASASSNVVVAYMTTPKSNRSSIASIHEEEEKEPEYHEKPVASKRAKLPFSPVVANPPKSFDVDDGCEDNLWLSAMEHREENGESSPYRDPSYSTIAENGRDTAVRRLEEDGAEGRGFGSFMTDDDGSYDANPPSSNSDLNSFSTGRGSYDIPRNLDGEENSSVWSRSSSHQTDHLDRDFGGDDSDVFSASGFSSQRSSTLQREDSLGDSLTDSAASIPPRSKKSRGSYEL